MVLVASKMTLCRLVTSSFYKKTREERNKDKGRGYEDEDEDGDGDGHETTCQRKRCKIRVVEKLSKENEVKRNGDWQSIRKAP